MRPILILATLGLLAACKSTLPGDAAVIERPPLDETAKATAADATESVATKSEGTATEDSTTGDSTPATEDSTPAGEDEKPAVAITTDNPSISDEQDFTAVTARVSIADDKARLKAQREQYVVIEPTELPKRRGKTVSVAEFALSTTNTVGERVYKRLSLLGAAQSKRACEKFASPEAAQLRFLTSGGPKRDPRNLDPDGDGFACGWTPDIYRTAAQ